MRCFDLYRVHWNWQSVFFGVSKLDWGDSTLEKFSVKLLDRLCRLQELVMQVYCEGGDTSRCMSLPLSVGARSGQSFFLLSENATYCCLLSDTRWNDLWTGDAGMKRKRKLTSFYTKIIRLLCIQLLNKHQNQYAAARKYTVAPN